MTLLKLSQFSCLRDGEPLFEPMDYTLSQGDLVQVVGPNGAGKTTFLRSLCGLYSEFEGSIFWKGAPLNPSDFEFLQHLFYLGHQTGVKKTLTARENVDWYFGLQDGASPQSSEELLARVGLSGYEDVPCQQLSAGQMRRVALARLFGSQRQLWVLDEPFTAIDVLGVAQLEGLIQRHCETGGSVLLTTHQAITLPGVKSWKLRPCIREEM